MKKLLFGVSLAGMLATANIALADTWQSDLSGTWTLSLNVFPNITTLVIDPYTASPQGTDCQGIKGTMFGSDAITGFYCLKSGRIYFVRNNAGKIIQAWSGNVSQVPNPQFGQKLQMSGTFAIVVPVGNDTYGEYNFHAVRQ